MPITSANKRDALLNNGYDPDKYDVTPDGVVYTKNNPVQTEQPQPTGINTPLVNQAQKENTSVTGAFAANAAAGVAPAVGGLAGASAAMAAAAPLAALTGPGFPWIEGGAGLVGAMGGGAAINWAQNKLLGKVAPQAAQYLEQSQADHPLVSMAGGLAGAVPVMGFSPRNVKLAADALVNRTGTGIALDAAQKANAINVALGAGLGAGQELYNGATSDEGVSLPRVALATAGGALLNSPTKYGQMIPGIHGVNTKDLRTTAEEVRQQGGKNLVTALNGPAEVPVVEAQRPMPETVSSGESYTPEQQALMLGRDPGEIGKTLTPSNSKSSVIDELSTVTQAHQEQVAAREVEAQNLRIERANTLAQKRAELEAAQYQAELSRLEAEKAKLAAGEDLPAADTQRLRAVPSNKEVIEPSAITDLGSIQAETPASTEPVKMPTSKPNFESEKSLEIPQGKYQPEDPVNPDWGAKESEVQLMKSKGIERPRGVKASFVKFLQDRYGALRNVKIEANGRITDSQGNEVRGVNLGRTLFEPNQIGLNAERATPDTAYHELMHTTIDDLKNSPVKSDQAVYEKIMKRVQENHPELNLSGADEQLAQTGGRDAVNYLLTDPSLKGTLKDVIGHLRVKWGNATTEQMARYLTRRLVHDPSFAETRGLAPEAPIVGSVDSEKASSEGPLKVDMTKTIERPVGVPDKSLDIPQGKFQPEEKAAKPSPFDAIRKAVAEAKPAEISKEQKPLNKVYDQSDTDPRRGRSTSTKFQPDNEDKRLYRTDTERQMLEPKPFGITADKYGTLPRATVEAKLKTAIPADELAALKESGIEQWLKDNGERVNAKRLAEWVKENGPKIEVRKFGEGSGSKELIAKLDSLNHNFIDRLPVPESDSLSEVANGRKTLDEHLKQFRQDDNTNDARWYRDNAKTWLDLVNDTKAYGDKEAAHWSFVAPKSEANMPGYTEIAVVKPSKERKGFVTKEVNQEAGLKFGSSHNFPPNTIAFSRGYMETLPNGKKVWHVVEVQSDWATQIKRDKADFGDQYDRTTPERHGITPNDPTLNHYENLALKASIEHARQQGADAIAISDANTAMLSEGHDRAAKPQDTEFYKTKEEAEARAKELSEDYNGLPTSIRHSDSLGWVVSVHDEITQAKGMREHYDRSLPNRLAKLTGSEGEMVNFGEHEKALRQSSYNPEEGTYGKSPREDLILTNPDGSLKTDVTARMYPLNKTSERLAAQDNKFGMFSKFQAENQPLVDKDPQRSIQLKATRAQFDKVADQSPEASDALNKFAFERSVLQGHANTAKEELSHIPVEEVKAAMAKMREAFREKKDFSPETEAERALSKFYGSYRDIQRQIGMKIHGREAGKNEAYVPDMISDEAVGILVEKPNSPEAQKLRKDWVDYLVSKGEKPLEAQRLVEDYVGGMKGNPLHGVEFGALRKAEGKGMPESIRETDPYRVLDKYARRASNDIAYYKHLQSNPRVAAALGLKVNGEKVRVEGVQDVSSTPEVEGAMKAVSNDFSRPSAAFTSATRLLSNSIMQLGTGIRNTAQVPSNIAPYLQRFSDLNALIKPMFEWKKNATDSLTTNARQKNLDDAQIGRVVDPSVASDWMDRASQILRKYSGREALEQMNRIYTYGVGDYLVRDNYQRMLSGDNGAKKFIEKFGKDSVNTEKIMKGEATEEDFMRMAKMFVDRTEGRYDASGLPIQAMEGPMAPYLSLSRWGIEKFNTVQKDVLTPAIRDGNYLPLLLYTGSSFLTGAAIAELNKILSHKKSQDPSISEALAADSQKDLVHSIIATMQMGSYGGIASDFAKAGSDLLLKGRKPQGGGLSFPMLDFVQNGVSQGLADWNEAVQQGVNPVEASLGLMQQLAKQSVQNYRYAYNNVGEGKEAAERSDKLRDLRIWEEMTQDKPTGEPIHSNKLLNADERKFKQTSDIGEAASELPKIIGKVISQYSSNPYLMTQKLNEKMKALKSNSYNTMPNVEDMPVSFASYISYLAKTQGIEEANKRVVDYFTQRGLNKAKSGMVPDL